jgi:hypothetical protein
MFKHRLITLSVFVVAVSLVFASDALAWQTFRYSIVSNGKMAGSEIDTYAPDGHIDSTFEFNDRGRGPKIAAHYVIDMDGSPVRVDITGNDYLKAPVDEHFAVEAGIGRWKSTSENGEAPAPGFYVSNNGSAAESSFLVSALLKAKNGPVKLFPGGEARLERMTDVTVESHGQKLHVTEFAITGLSFEPQTVWLDDDQHFFGLPGKWFAFLREGWEDTNDQLYKDSYRAMLRMTKRMYDAGIPILAGTDATAGLMLHRELELEVEAGIPPAKALQIATINAARLLKQDKDLGSIAPGKRADLVLVEGNPADHISDIRRCRLVAKSGVLYKSVDVYAAAGIKPAQ